MLEKIEGEVYQVGVQLMVDVFTRNFEMTYGEYTGMVLFIFCYSLSDEYLVKFQFPWENIDKYIEIAIIIFFC